MAEKHNKDCEVGVILVAFDATKIDMHPQKLFDAMVEAVQQEGKYTTDTTVALGLLKSEADEEFLKTKIKDLTIHLGDGTYAR